MESQFQLSRPQDTSSCDVISFNLWLVNCYARRFYLLYESELSFAFGTDLVAGKRGIGEARCDWEPAKISWSSAEVD